MDFRDRHIVITGGAGALGTALVGTLIEAGAICHIPCFDEAEAQRFALRAHKQVELTVTGNLADEQAVARLYERISTLWASIHLAGGFAAGPLRETSAATIHQQIDMNLVSCLLCCRAAVNAMAGNGGRIVNVAARAALEWRSGAGMTAYTASKAAVAALSCGAGRGSRQGRHPRQRGGAFDHGYAGQSQSHAEGRLQSLAEGRGSGGDDHVSRVARKPRHARRCRAGVWQVVAASQAHFPGAARHM